MDDLFTWKVIPRALRGAVLPLAPQHSPAGIGPHLGIFLIVSGRKQKKIYPTCTAHQGAPLSESSPVQEKYIRPYIT